jgi:hypothetical protein
MASKCKIVNVVLNSNNKASGTNNQATYYMDWSSILKDNTQYYLHFTYMGCANTITGTKLALVYADFQTSNKLNSATQNGASSTQFLGCLKSIVLVGGTSNTGYLQAEDNTIVPTFLESRPTNNQFTITVLDNASPPALYLDNTPVAVGPPATQPVPNGNYVRVLSFREVTEDD